MNSNSNNAVEKQMIGSIDWAGYARYLELQAYHAQQMRLAVFHEIATRSRTGRCQFCGAEAEYDGVARGNYTEFCEACAE